MIYVGGLVAFLYYGSSEGIAPFWAFLLPFMSYFLYGMKYGSMIAGGYLIVAMIMLWVPYDLFLAYDYSAGFLKRIPIIYAAAYLAASGTEYIRVLTRRRLDAAVAELEEITMIDTLTGIENRRSFEGRLNETWHIFSGKENYISVLLIDIDYFKYYNDTYGHLKGDEALKRVADTLKKTVSQGHGYVSRWGGEEFICLLPFYDNGQAVSMAKEVLEAIEDQAIEHWGSELPGHILTVSIGVATVNATSGIDPKEVIRGADESLYEAKSYGRNRMGRSRTYG